MELDTKLRDQTHHHNHATQQQQQPMFLSENYMKPDDDDDDDKPYEVPSSKGTPITYLQDFDHHHHHNQHYHHHQLINLNGSSSSNHFAVQTPCFEPFDAFPYNYYSSSNFDFYECKPLVDHHNHLNNNSGNGQVMDNFESGGYLNNNSHYHHNHHQVSPIGIIGTDHENHMQSDFHQEMMKPINFLVPDDELSCDGYCQKADTNKKNNREYPSSARNKPMKNSKKPNVVKGQWTVEEDRQLMRLVEEFGIRKWSHIAQVLPGRIGKQCRERWHNHLRPNIKKDTWSEEEDKALIEAHAEIGNKWAEIAKRLPGRTENSIKNHWNATKRRQFSKRKCRSKYPRAFILQDYIKSLNLDATSSSKYQRRNHSNNAAAAAESAANNNNTTKGKAAKGSAAAAAAAEQGFYPNDHLVPDFDFNEVPDFDFDEKLFDENNCSIDSLMEEMPCCAPVVADHNKMDNMEVPLDVTPAAAMEFEVKKEMDLVDIISPVVKPYE